MPLHPILKQYREKYDQAHSLGLLTGSLTPWGQRLSQERAVLQTCTGEMGVRLTTVSVARESHCNFIASMDCIVSSRSACTRVNIFKKGKKSDEEMVQQL